MWRLHHRRQMVTEMNLDAIIAVSFFPCFLFLFFLLVFFVFWLRSLARSIVERPKKVQQHIIYIYNSKKHIFFAQLSAFAAFHSFIIVAIVSITIIVFIFSTQLVSARRRHRLWPRLLLSIVVCCLLTSCALFSIVFHVTTAKKKGRKTRTRFVFGAVAIHWLGNLPISNDGETMKSTSNRCILSICWTSNNGTRYFDTWTKRNELNWPFSPIGRRKNDRPTNT